MPATFDNVTVSGTLTANSARLNSASINRSNLVQDDLKPFAINFTDLRVWDAFQTNLPGTSAADDLGLYGGTFGSASPLVRTYDVKAAGAQSLYARFKLRIPAEYVTGETITLRAHAGMVTTVADVSCTIDFEAFRSNTEGGIGSDLVTTAATSMNSLTYADKDFTIDPATLSAGDELDVRMKIATNDAATATAVIAAVGKLTLLCDVRG